MLDAYRDVNSKDPHRARQSSGQPWFRAAVLMIAVAIVGLGALLMPGAQEWQAVLVRDGRYAEALGALSRTAQGPGNALEDGLAQVALLKAQGRHEEALHRLDELAAAWPADYAVQTGLMAALRSLGRSDRLEAVAERVFDRWREREAVKVLLTLASGRGDQRAQLDILRRAAFVGAVSIGQLERLGLMEAAAGNDDVALQHLIDVDATREGLSRTGRLTMLDLLIARGKIDEGMRRVRAWLRQSADGDGAPEYCVGLAMAGRADLAWEALVTARGMLSEHVKACVVRLGLFDAPGAADEVAHHAAARSDGLAAATSALEAACRQATNPGGAEYVRVPGQRCGEPAAHNGDRGAGRPAE